MTPEQAGRFIAAAHASTYAVRLAHARAVVAYALDTARPVVSYSGGRDSTVVLELARELRPDVRAVYVDTGIAHPAHAAWVQQHAGAALVTLRPPCTPPETWRSDPCLPIGGKLAGSYYRKTPGVTVNPTRCCEVHKTRPAHAWHRANGTTTSLVGLRASDSQRHAFRLAAGEIQQTAGETWRSAYPILTWTTDDVVRFLADRVPDFPPILPRGCRADLGCLPCMVGLARTPNSAEYLRRHVPDVYRRAMVDPPDGYGYARQILQLQHGWTPDQADAFIADAGWDRLLADGTLDRIPRAAHGLR